MKVIMKTNLQPTLSAISLWIILLMLSGCGPTINIFSDVDDTGRFEQYKTYNFQEFSEGNKKTITGMELERLRVAFAREFEQRGFKYDDQYSDVSVKITVFHREASDASYGYAGAYNYMERAISVDMYDNQTRTHVWHCAAVGELVYDPGARAEELPDVVARIFEKYPFDPAEGN